MQYRKKNNQHKSLTRFAWLSIAAALITITLKTTAYLLTGSVRLFPMRLNHVLIWPGL